MKTKLLTVLTLVLTSATVVNGQSTTNNNFFTPLKYLGYFNPGNLNFRTSGVLRMRLNSAQGYLGIGSNAVLPGNLIFTLTVDNNIDVNPNNTANPFDGYRISNQRFLFMPGGVGLNNTFVGICGNASNYGNDNTAVGFGAGGGMGTGMCNSGALYCTAVGENAGYKMNGVALTCIGYQSGYNTSDGDYCTFVGGNAGYSVSCGKVNSFFGGFAGYNALNGNGNIAIGYFSAKGLTGTTFGTGSDNIAIGSNNGVNLGDNNANILLGNNADIAPPTVSQPTITNSIAIGNNAIVNSNNKMILGDTTMWVGIGLSNDNSPTLGPGNSLEINSRTQTGTVISNSSGLRFRQLNANSPTVANQGNMGYLALSTSGDVIYVPAPTGSGGLGNTCSTPVSSKNYLTATWEIPMTNPSGNSYNFMFNEATAGGAGEVGIGHAYGACNNIAGKFEVISSMHKYAGAFQNTASLSGSNTLAVIGSASSTLDDAIGVKGVSSGAATGNFNAVGVFGLSINMGSNSFNIGVDGQAASAQKVSMAGRFMISNSSSPMNVGTIGSIGNFMPTLSANAASIGGNIDIGVYGYCPVTISSNTSASWAGYFDGDVKINGTGYITNPIWQVSDKRFKKNILPLENVMDKISKLNGYTYSFRQEEFKEKNFDDSKHIGLIAQELNEVFPELVKQDAQGYYTVNYEGMIPVLLEAIKELKKEVDDMKSGQQVGMQNNSGNSTILNIELTDKNMVVLNQNVPNPFAEQTAITYNIPDNTGFAQILFYNAAGQLIKAVDIKEKGKGQLNVFANDLSSGIYTYTLVIDGQPVETKRMTKQ